MPPLAPEEGWRPGLWTPLKMAGVAFIGPGALALMMWADKLDWLVPRGSMQAGPPAHETHAWPMIQFVAIASLLLASGAVALAITQIVRRRKEPPSSDAPAEALAILAGFAAVVFALGVLVAGSVLARPWSFG